MTVHHQTTQPQNSIRNSALITNINEIINSVWGIGILGILTFIAFTFSLELEFYTFVALYTIYVSIFSEDLRSIMPLFILCYITPSKINNPGTFTGGLFYGETGTYLIAVASVSVLALILRIILDPKMGLRRLLTTKRALLPSMLILGASYLLSGILHPQYAEYAKNNLIFASIQFASVFLLYVIFSAAIDWESFDFDYFAALGLTIGLVVAAEVGITYLVGDVISDGAIIRYQIQTGWGCYNNVGAIITISIPFAFYFASRKTENAIFFFTACFLFVAVIFSCSRGSLVGALFAFIPSIIYTFVTSENKIQFRISSFVLLIVLLLMAVTNLEKLIDVFRNVPAIFVQENDNITASDSGRFDYYKAGFQVFLRNPIFGQSFYPIEHELYSFSVVSDFISFFPPRWHNTVIQMIASCGIVGLIAYLYHRFKTIELYFKKPTKENTYLLFAMISFCAMSFLDCHFFNVGPVFFYSMTFAVAEFAPTKYKK